MFSFFYAYSSFFIPAILLIAVGLMLAQRRAGLGSTIVVFGVVLGSIPIVFTLIWATGMSQLDGRGKSKRDPSTVSGKACKHEILSKFGCDPWVWNEKINPTADVTGFCVHKSENATALNFDADDDVLIDGCKYSFRCSFDVEGVVKKSELYLADSQIGRKKECSWKFKNTTGVRGKLPSSSKPLLKDK